MLLVDGENLYVATKRYLGKEDKGRVTGHILDRLGRLERFLEDGFGLSIKGIYYTTKGYLDGLERKA